MEVGIIFFISTKKPASDTDAGFFAPVYPQALFYFLIRRFFPTCSFMTYHNSVAMKIDE